MPLEHPFAYIRSDKILRKAWNQYPSFEIGEVKNDDPGNSIRYFEERFTELENQIETLSKRIEEENNKGSFLLKLAHLKKTLVTHKGIGDYEVLDERLKGMIFAIEDWVAQNQQNNLQIKESLLNDLRVAIDKINWQEASKAISEIKYKWKRIGGIPENVADGIESEFSRLIEEFNNRKKAFYDDRRKLQEHYESNYREIISKAEKLLEFPAPSADHLIRELENEWKDTGGIPPQAYQVLHKTFRSIISRIKESAKSENVSKIHQELLELKKTEPNSKIVKQILSRLQLARPANKKERELHQNSFELARSFQEEAFIIETLRKKIRDFDKKSVNEKKKLKSQMLKDLIHRDKTDLELYRLNQEKFRTSDDSVQKMLDRKIEHQKKHLKIKEELLKELKGK